MATLKISDLSVGDWIHHDFYELDMRVRTIYEDTERIIAESSSGYSVTCHLDHFRPILITPEILKKNGFEENCGRWYNSEALMEFEQYKDGWCRTMNCGEYSVYFIKYVHQLQHALRLAEVEKEIVIPKK